MKGSVGEGRRNLIIQERVEGRAQARKGWTEIRKSPDGSAIKGGFVDFIKLLILCI